MFSKKHDYSEFFINDVVGEALPFAHQIALVHNMVFYDVFSAASKSEKKRLGIASIHTKKYCACVAREVSLPLLNRCVNLGIINTLTKEDLEEVGEWMKKNANSSWSCTLSSILRPQNITELLRNNGYQPKYGGMAHFWRDAIPITAHLSDSINIIAARKIEHRSVFKEIYDECFKITPKTGEWFSALVGRRDWYCYVAYYNSEPAGIGAFMVNKNIAWLGIGATLPAMRSKGIQQALLARRINDACALGINGLTVGCSYSELDVIPYSTSGRNILRAGFKLSYVSKDFTLEK